MRRHDSIPVVFFRSDSGREPVRAWLKGLDRGFRIAVEADIKVLQLRWPAGMPLVRKISGDLWELRSRLGSGIARVFFTVQEGKLVLLHGFLKKSRKMPTKERAVAMRRLRTLRSQ